MNTCVSWGIWFYWGELAAVGCTAHVYRLFIRQWNRDGCAAHSCHSVHTAAGRRRPRPGRVQAGPARDEGGPGHAPAALRLPPFPTTAQVRALQYMWLDSAHYTFPICVYSDSGWHRHGQIKLILCGSRVMWLFSRGINIQHFDMDHPLNIYLLFKHWSDVAEENDSDVTEFLPNVKDLRNLVYNLIRLQVKLLQVYLYLSSCKLCWRLV